MSICNFCGIEFTKISNKNIVPLIVEIKQETKEIVINLS